MSSPTQRTLKHLRELGYKAQVVEHFNSWTKRRIDLFTIIDVVAVGHGETLGVQCTSGSNVSSRVAKIADAEATPALREAGWKLVVHGWRKNSKNRWVLREVDVS